MEETKSANEEMQSVNEELQSSNEELETSKEEMQSINEELQTVNGELQSKNDALPRVNNDLQNLLDSTQIATLFLDGELRIRNFTPAMTAIFHLREGDIGRPITEIVSKLNYADPVRDAEEVQRTLAVVEREVQPRETAKTRRFCCASGPIARVDNRLDGIVMTFIEVSGHEARQVGRRSARLRSSSRPMMRSSARTSTALLQSWNKGAERLFGYTAEEMVGKVRRAAATSGS